ncbi:MAG: hypothetical protein GY719_31780, partial [bacterium]|nr:hypothetical protein [bacterium]
MTEATGPLAPAARFDPEWYLLAYPDVGDADAAAHYREHGAAEGRDPNVLFSERWYSGAHPDVAGAVEAGHFASGFEHFVAFGHRDGRHPNGLRIDEAWYRSSYPEAAAALDDGRFDSAYEHYLTRGATRGFDPHAAFSEGWYLDRNPDVAEAVAS